MRPTTSRRRAVLATGALTLGLAAATLSGVGSGAAADPGPSERAAQRAADRALAAVERIAERRTDALDAPGRGRDLTIALRDLRLALPALDGPARSDARTYLARPTDDDGSFLDYQSGANVTNDCQVSPVTDSRFCIWWARSTRDAPPLADGDDDGVPDQVERTRTTMNAVWERLVTEGTYPAPPADGRGPNGFRDRFDVYLGDLGDLGVYGYCTTDAVSPATQRAASHCALDDDFARDQFPTNTPLGNLRVTAAHEFFHAVQFGIDWTEDAFFLENSSTWVEDEIYDAVNDNRNYFPASALRRPADPLDLDDNWYGNWIWLRFLTETFPDEGSTDLPLLVRDAWDRAGDPGVYSVRALEGAVTAAGGNFSELVADFATANRNPAGFYEEGSAYPTAPLARSVDVARRTQSGTTTVDHLASGTVGLVPTNRPAGAELRVTIDAPSFPSDLQVNVTRYARNGAVNVNDVTLDAQGNGTVKVKFASGNTRRVEVTMANAGRDYTCDQDRIWACSGIPRDDNRTFAWTARPLAPR